jgi:hypothetical protein
MENVKPATNDSLDLAVTHKLQEAILTIFAFAPSADAAAKSAVKEIRAAQKQYPSLSFREDLSEFEKYIRLGWLASKLNRAIIGGDSTSASET